MTLEEYMKWQPKLAAYELNDFPEDSKLEQAIIEMTGEAGEVLQLMTKARRKGVRIDHYQLLDEVGDVLWGLIGIMNVAGFKPEEVMMYNYNKLEQRYKK